MKQPLFFLLREGLCERDRRDDFRGGVDVETGNIPHQGNELQISNAVLQIRPNAFHDTMAPPEALPPVSTEDFLVSYWALTSMKPCRETRSGRKPLLWDGPLTTVAFLEGSF